MLSWQPGFAGDLTVSVEGSGAGVLSLERRGSGYSLVLGRPLDREDMDEIDVTLVATECAGAPTQLNVKFRSNRERK